MRVQKKEKPEPPAALNAAWRSLHPIARDCYEWDGSTVLLIRPGGVETAIAVSVMLTREGIQ